MNNDYEDTSIYTVEITIKSYGGTHELTYTRLIKGVDTTKLFGDLTSRVNKELE